MTDQYTLAKKIFTLDNGASNFSDPDGKVTESTRGAMVLAANICGCSVEAIREELTDLAQTEDQAQREEDELQYGGLNEYGEFPHEANAG